MRSRTGSIDTTTNGRLRVRVSLPSGRKTVGVFDTIEEAERERTAAAKILGSLDGFGETFGEWTEKQITRREITNAVVDSDSEWSWFKNHIAPDPIAKLAPKSIRPGDVDDFVERLESKLAAQSVRNVIQICRASAHAALRKELIKANPFIKVKVKADKRTDHPWTFANPAEQDRLVAAAAALAARSSRTHHTPLDAMIEFAIGAGLRAGELVTLRLRDVHVDGAHPHVVVRYGGTPSKPTKRNKIREVPLFGRSLHAMRRWLDSMPRWVPRNPHGLVFVGLRGSFRSEDHVLKWADWKWVLDHAGITRTFRWHDLRHTCASSLVSGWWGRSWSLEEVRDMLGHESITTTERYAHLADTALKKAASATNWPGGSQGGGIVIDSDEFVNRRSRVQVSKAAPGKSGSIVEPGAKRAGQLVAVSRGLLKAVADGRGEDAERLSGELTDLVLADPAVALALSVRAGGPLALTRAISLAELVAAACGALPSAEVGS